MFCQNPPALILREEVPPDSDDPRKEAVRRKAPRVRASRIVGRECEQVRSILSEASGARAEGRARAGLEPFFPRGGLGAVEQRNEIRREPEHGLGFLDVMLALILLRELQRVERERVVRPPDPAPWRLEVAPGCFVTKHDFHRREEKLAGHDLEKNQGQNGRRPR